jgi:uncharacterized phage protein gp47/JayE
MPTNNGEYVKLTAEQIQNNLEQTLDDKLGTTAQAGDLVTSQLEAEAETLAQNQEEALERVYRAAYLEDATGRELDKVVDIIGLTRIESNPATGVVQLWRESPPTADYTIPKGSQVQTSGTSPITFSVSEQTALDYIDGWETNNLDNWSGDKSNFSVVETTALTGNYALEVPATSGVGITTVQDDFGIGTTFGAQINPGSGSSTAIRVGVQDDSNYFEAVLDEGSQDLRLRLIEDGSQVASSLNDSATIPVSESSYVEVEWNHFEASSVTVYNSKTRDSELCTVELSASREWDDGAVSIFSLDGTATALVDEVSTRSVLANIIGVDVGTETNVGPNTINTISDSISGVQQVTNPIATGNPSSEDLNFSSLVTGRDEETDEELRDRAFNSTSIGGSATLNAISTELRRVEGVKALTIKRNREETNQNGLPPHSFEPIVYGGSDEDVARTIFETASIDSHDVGGINGNSASYTITSDVTKDTEEINWSRPLKLNLDLTLDLIVDDNYVGDTEIQSIVTKYIGGTGLEGNFITGLDVGEDVYEAVLQRKVVSPEETGVWEVDSLSIDTNGDGTDDTTTTASGADVLVVEDNEVAITDARDGSITITTTLK